MRKLAAGFLVTLVMALGSSMPVLAQFENPPLVDEAGYLFQEEAAELWGRMDDIYDYQGYGAGEDADGILLYLCADTREYHFTTHGYGLTAFNARGLAYLEKQILPFLQERWCCRL